MAKSTVSPMPAMTPLQLVTNDALTAPEQTRLEFCEERIQKGLATFIEVGTALLEIRDSRLYRETHSTFENYCRDRWQLQRQRVYGLVDAAKVINNLTDEMSSIGGHDKSKDFPLPDNERQTRPLAKLEPEEQRTAWELAVTSADTMEEAVTAALVAVSAKIAQQQQRDLPSGVKAILDTKDPQVVQKVIQEYTAQKTIPKRIPAVLPAESPLARPNDAPLQKDDAEYRGPQTQDEAAALWVHGRMLEFEKKGYLTPGFNHVIFDNMHSNQRQDATRLVQSILQFFYELGVLLNESATTKQ